MSSGQVCCRHGRFYLELTAVASHSQQEAQLSQWDALAGGAYYALTIKSGEVGQVIFDGFPT